jgi:hypothetical protein
MIPKLGFINPTRARKTRILLLISSKIAFKGNYEIIYRKDAKGAKGLLIPLWPAMALLRKHCKAMLSTIEMERGAVKRSE